MRSLQNNYNLIKEGKGSKELFLKQVRKEFPQYISNIQNFTEATTKLKEKGIISENTSGNLPAPVEKINWFNNFAECLTEVKATEKKTSSEVEALSAHNFDYKEKSNVDNLIGAEVLRGFYVEMNDPKNKDKTQDKIEAIVIKNLTKDPIYYVKNGQFGVKGLGYTETPVEELKGKYKSSGYGDMPIVVKEHKTENNSTPLKEGSPFPRKLGEYDSIIGDMLTATSNMVEYVRDQAPAMRANISKIYDAISKFDAILAFKQSNIPENVEEDTTDESLEALQRLIDEVISTKK